jgi:hypothetical protein
MQAAFEIIFYSREGATHSAEKIYTKRYTGYESLFVINK